MQVGVIINFDFMIKIQIIFAVRTKCMFFLTLSENDGITMRLMSKLKIKRD